MLEDFYKQYRKNQAELERQIMGEPDSLLTGHYNKLGSKTRLKIIEICQNIEGGTFIEAGACMGTDTKILEQFGWNGMLIEPSKSLYRWCKNNRKCIVENYALVSNEYYKNNKFIIGNQINIMIIPGSRPESPIKKFRVSTFTKLCKKNKISHVDIFILDAEGYEMEVLNGIDFDKININNFIIEVNNNVYKLRQLNKFMEGKGYINRGLVEKLSHIQSDYLYSKIL